MQIIQQQKKQYEASMNPEAVPSTSKSASVQDHSKAQRQREDPDDPAPLLTIDEDTSVESGSGVGSRRQSVSSFQEEDADEREKVARQEDPRLADLKTIQAGGGGEG